ncbi:MAG: glycosyltransferase family 39 protein [Elusimicrobiota bacterium]
MDAKRTIRLTLLTRRNQDRIFQGALWLHAAALASCLAFFSYWSLRDIGQQGIYTDVGMLGDMALGIYKKFPFSGPQFLHLAGYSIPLMVKEWHGAVPVYLALPWICLFGNKAVALHLAPVFLSTVSLILFYAVAWLCLGSVAACFAAAAMLASSPAFIAASRLGLYTGTELVLWEMGCVLFFMLWKRRGKFAYALAGLCSLGFGLGSRLFFFWFAAALLLYALIWERPLLQSLASTPRRLAAAVGAASLGLMPFILANILGSGVSLKFLAKHALNSADGYSNLDYPSHLWLRLREIVSILNGSAWSGISEPNRWFPWFMLLAVAWSLRRNRFFCMTAVFILIQSPLTPTAIEPHHLIIMLPLLCLAAASSLIPRSRSLPGLIIPIVLSALLVVSFAGNYRLLHSEKAYINLHGGDEVRYNAMGDVVAWLRRHNIREIGLGDTGMMDPFNYLSGRRIEEREIFWAPYLNVPKPFVIDRLEKRLEDERAGGYYLFRAPGHGWIHFFKDFRAIAAREGKTVVAKKVFSDPAGEPIFILCFVS